eukprot:TRINITY_DN14044_c0_g3_i1.p3 TRINITY_DN14044_c0_g3~~TRINITY_DN14044_c0_g3_i1.p3  ORF type:complete len:133 (+),score=14.45 TRINITY_DN14044_c0_g3_i1:1002-1400(+)
MKAYEDTLDKRYYSSLYRQGTHTEVVVNCSVEAIIGGVVTTRGYPFGFNATYLDRGKTLVRAFLQQVLRDVPQLQGRSLPLVQYHPGGGVVEDNPTNRGCARMYCGDVCADKQNLEPASVGILEVIRGAASP